MIRNNSSKLDNIGFSSGINRRKFYVFFSIFSMLFRKRVPSIEIPVMFIFISLFLVIMILML